MNKLKHNRKHNDSLHDKVKAYSMKVERRRDQGET